MMQQLASEASLVQTYSSRQHLLISASGRFTVEVDNEKFKYFANHATLNVDAFSVRVTNRERQTMDIYIKEEELCHSLKLQ